MVEVDARARAAAALRRFGHELHRRAPDDELLLRVAAAADAVTEELAAAPVRERDPAAMRRTMFRTDVPEGEQLVHFEECFVSGPHNPMGIGVAVRREADEAVADVTLGWAWEGAPGRTHGGVVAAIFDDVLGYLLTLERQPAYTGELAVRYLAGVPIGVPLRFRARVERFEGRKLDTSATVRVVVDGREDGEPVATATARFITIDDYAPDGHGPAT